MLMPIMTESSINFLMHFKIFMITIINIHLWLDHLLNYNAQCQSGRVYHCYYIFDTFMFCFIPGLYNANFLQYFNFNIILNVKTWHFYQISYTVHIYTHINSAYYWVFPQLIKALYQWQKIKYNLNKKKKRIESGTLIWLWY